MQYTGNFARIGKIQAIIYIYISWDILYIVIIIFSWYLSLSVPSPDTYPKDGPPDQFIDPWTDKNPVYLRFASDGVHVENDFKLTYNIALDEQDKKEGRT